ncbi:hypothetical protein Sste5346_006862 [Sporothrix stenoceras]|uniref:Dipeptidyl-peptidase V n=1 Tax=Sporothrix stenoceras TaxID=5173 RepID=A0ABR3YWL5_9PEZI
MAKTSAALLQDILDLVVPATVRVSPDGKHVAYSACPKLNHRKADLAVAAIWIAETATCKSARRFTDGLYYDYMPEWSLDGLSVAFLSNRGNGSGSDDTPKRTCAIHLQNRDSLVSRAVTPLDRFPSISKMTFSPDGKSIAFVAPRKSEQREKGNDATVWGQGEDFQHLWLLDVESGRLRVLFDGDAHVDDFVWCDGGDELVALTHRSRHADSKYQHGTTLTVLRVADRRQRQLCHVPSAVWSPVWLGSTLYFLTNNIPEQDTSGMAVYRVLGGGQEQPLFEKVAHGEVDCAVGLVRAGNDLLVHVEHGVEEKLRLLLGGQTLVAQKKHIVNYDVSGSVQDLCIVLSRGDVNHPTELFSLDSSTGGVLQLSDHGRTLADTTFGHCHFLACPTLDGEEVLDGLYLVPSQCAGGKRHADGRTRPSTAPAAKLPTLVLVHGGPYARATDAFDAYNPLYLLIQPLLTEGYGILLPNYRGGSSRGQHFAGYARGGMGVYDEPDIVAIVQHAIDRGYADPARLVVGGWSQGGYLSYLSAVRNGAHGLGWRFCGAIAGAGITDWDSMMLTSDVGARYEAQFAGSTPWNTDKTDVRTRSGSALWEFKEAARHGRIPPMLMLHGEKDDRVPISQAWGFQRALDEAGLPFEFVTYPREGHVPRERKHLEDLTERMLRFIRDRLL